MIQSLYELILNIVKNNDEKSKLLILEKFNKTIKYYTKQLNYYCAETDLVIFMLTLINKLDLKKIKNFEENTLIKYINGSIKHEYIRLSKKNSYINSHEILLGEDIMDYIDNDKHERSMENPESVKCIAENLTGNQRKIFLYFLKGYSITEISKLMGISRQAIYKAKKIILKFSAECKK